MRGFSIPRKQLQMICLGMESSMGAASSDGVGNVVYHISSCKWGRQRCKPLGVVSNTFKGQLTGKSYPIYVAHNYFIQYVKIEGMHVKERKKGRVVTNQSFGQIYEKEWKEIKTEGMKGIVHLFYYFLPLIRKESNIFNKLFIIFKI